MSCGQNARHFARSSPPAFGTGRDHVLSSYGENLRQQGSKLKQILAANDGDTFAANDLVLVQWSKSDLALLRDATIQLWVFDLGNTLIREEEAITDHIRQIVNALAACGLRSSEA